MRFLLGGRARWAALGAIVAGLAAGGIAYASIPDAGGTIHTCYNKTGGALYVIDTALGQHCNLATQGQLDWNQTGPQGPSGPSGPSGAGGPSGPSGASGVVADAGKVNNTPQSLVTLLSTPTTVDSISITLPKAGDLLSAASTDVLTSNHGLTEIGCALTLDNVEMSNHAFTDLSPDSNIALAVISLTGFAASVPAGQHTVALRCEVAVQPVPGTSGAASYAIHAWEGA
jgi:hypothetical protein